MFNPARLVRFYLFAVVTFSLGMPFPCAAREFHVSVDGNDANAGSKTDMLRTIQSAADKARPGDIITVHEGVYRERVNPPRGGQSDEERIVYQAAPGENVVIKGSEVIKGGRRFATTRGRSVCRTSFSAISTRTRIEFTATGLIPRGGIITRGPSI